MESCVKLTVAVSLESAQFGYQETGKRPTAKLAGWSWARQCDAKAARQSVVGVECVCGLKVDTGSQCADVLGRRVYGRALGPGIARQRGRV